MIMKQMPRLVNRHRSRVIPLLALAASFLPSAHIVAQGAQTPLRVPTPAEVKKSDSNPASEETLQLSPFEVRADTDNGYLATSAQSGTRLRSELKDIAASVSVVTKDFMNDIGARNLEDLLTYTTNTEVGGISGNFSES